MTMLRSNSSNFLKSVMLTGFLFGRCLFVYSQSLGGVDVVSRHRVIRENVNERDAAFFRENPQYDLNRFPLLRYEIDTSSITPISVGDTIPALVLDLPLWVAYAGQDTGTISLRAFGDGKLLVLDLWATWCAPCVASMDKWEGFSDSLPGRIGLVGVHNDLDYKAPPFIDKKGWISPSVIGLNAHFLARFFFTRSVVSKIVWIKDGRLIAITGTKGYDLALVKKVIAGEDVEIPMALEWTYSKPPN